MTPEQSFKFRCLVSNLINATISGETSSRQLAHEDHLRNWVTGLMEEKDAEVERLKARDVRFIQHCDDLGATLKDIVNHHRSNNTASVIVKIQMEHGVDLAPIFNPDLNWYRFTSPDQILEKWLNAHISEGLAADL